MSIQEKIDEIRKKPEHIRLRWAWGLTAVSIFLIIIIWLTSVRFQVRNSQKETSNTNQEDLLEQFGQDKKSLKDATEELKNNFNNLKDQDQNIQNNLDQEGFGQNAN